MSSADVSLSLLRGAIAPLVRGIQSNVGQMVKGLDAHQERIAGAELDVWLAARGDLLASSMETHAEGMSRTLQACIASLQAAADARKGMDT